MSYIRDYCHVVDLAKGHVHCMKVMFGPNSNKVWAYNLGTGRCKTNMYPAEFFGNFFMQKFNL